MNAQTDLKYLVAFLGLFAIGSIYAAPVGNAYEYRVNLTRPCGPEGTGPIIISTDKLPLPDMVGITKTAMTAVSNVLDEVVRRLDVPNHELEDLQEETWPLVSKLQHELGPVETSCQQENHQDALAALWQNLLQYIPVVNHMKKYEVYYAGHQTGVILRSTTFEHEINDLEENNLATLLCGFQVIGEDQMVSLADQIFERNAEVYNLTIDETVHYHIVDKHLYIVLHNLMEDFLDYANRFFECSQLNES